MKLYMAWCIIACITINCYPAIPLTIIGIGRLGLCMALAFEKAGFSVMGVDLNSDYVDSLNKKTFVSSEPGVIEYLNHSTNFKATTHLDDALKFSDIYFIAVDTPSGTNEAYDHTKLNSVLSAINERKVQNKHIVISCTVFPGYCSDKAPQLLADCSNVSINYNPEFIAQGSILHDFEHPDMILIGEGSAGAGDLLESIYRALCKNNPKLSRMSTISAEIAKLALNCFITTKIAYANMVAEIAQQTPHANATDILDAVGSDSRIGPKNLKAGYGFGGPCFPRDNRALGAYAKTIGIQPIIPSATDKANALHAEYMAKHMMKKDDSPYIFEDVNYKPNCPVVILEESQKLAVAEILAKRGCRVIIKDRADVIIQVIKKYGSLFSYEVT